MQPEEAPGLGADFAADELLEADGLYAAQWRVQTGLTGEAVRIPA